MAIPNIPFEDRLAFWKFQNATVAFEQVCEICKILLSDNIEDGHPLHIPLQTALHIHYGKPFKQKRPVNLLAVFVPSEFTEIHNELIMMRDKIHAHTDPNSPPTMDDVSINKVIIMIQENHVSFATTLLFPRLNRIQQVCLLAELLAEKASDSVMELWNTHMGGESVPSGNYSVNLKREEGLFFEPLDWGLSPKQ